MHFVQSASFCLRLSLACRAARLMLLWQGMFEDLRQLNLQLFPKGLMGKPSGR
jgi:hypothetical protein